MSQVAAIPELGKRLLELCSIVVKMLDNSPSHTDLSIWEGDVLRPDCYRVNAVASLRGPVAVLIAILKDHPFAPVHHLCENVQPFLHDFSIERPFSETTNIIIKTRAGSGGQGRVDLAKVEDSIDLFDIAVKTSMFTPELLELTVLRSILLNNLKISFAPIVVLEARSPEGPQIVTVYRREHGRQLETVTLVEPLLALGFVTQAAKMVKAMHANGVCHGDIYKRNVIVYDRDLPFGGVKFVDDGLCVFALLESEAEFELRQRRDWYNLFVLCKDLISTVARWRPFLQFPRKCGNEQAVESRDEWDVWIANADSVLTGKTEEALIRLATSRIDQLVTEQLAIRSRCVTILPYDVTVEERTTTWPNVRLIDEEDCIWYEDRLVVFPVASQSKHNLIAIHIPMFLKLAKAIPGLPEYVRMRVWHESHDNYYVEVARESTPGSKVSNYVLNNEPLSKRQIQSIFTLCKRMMEERCPLTITLERLYVEPDGCGIMLRPKTSEIFPAAAGSSTSYRSVVDHLHRELLPLWTTTIFDDDTFKIESKELIELAAKLDVQEPCGSPVVEEVVLHVSSWSLDVSYLMKARTPTSKTHQYFFVEYMIPPHSCDIQTVRQEILQGIAIRNSIASDLAAKWFIVRGHSLPPGGGGWMSVEGDVAEEARKVSYYHTAYTFRSITCIFFTTPEVPREATVLWRTRHIKSLPKDVYKKLIELWNYSVTVKLTRFGAQEFQGDFSPPSLHLNGVVVLPVINFRDRNDRN